MIKIKLVTVIMLLSIFSCFSQKTFTQPKKEKWVLGTTFGYTTVVTPFNRNNFQLVLNLRYRTGPYTIGIQPGFNYTYETKTPDLRIGLRLQYDFLSW